MTNGQGYENDIALLTYLAHPGKERLAVQKIIDGFRDVEIARYPEALVETKWGYEGQLSLPKTDDTLNMLADSKLFLTLKGGYWQVELNVEDR